MSNKGIPKGKYCRDDNVNIKCKYLRGSVEWLCGCCNKYKQLLEHSGIILKVKKCPACLKAKEKGR